MLIDFHTHCFPDSLAPKAISKLEASGSIKAFTDGTASGLINSMRESGIDYSVLLPIAATPSQTVKINDISIQNNKKDNLFWFGSVHPHYENIRYELDRLKDAGIKGIKLHPDFQGVFIDAPETVEVMKYASTLGLLLTIHGGMDISFPDLHRSTPKRLYSVLNQLEVAKIICAHMGGYMYLDDVEKYLMNSNSVYIDTSFSIGKMDTEQIKRILNTFDSERILFGTDSPWDSQKKALNDIKSLNISHELEDKILYKNACRLLDISL